MYEKHEFHLTSGEEKCSELSAELLRHAEEERLRFTRISLALMREEFAGAVDASAHPLMDKERLLGIAFHSLCSAEILVDLHPALTKEEEDTMLASALCHPLFALVPDDAEREALLAERFDSNIVFRVMEESAVFGRWTDGERRNYFQALRGKKLAMLLRLAERACFAEQLFELPSADAANYVRETKNLYFPLCIDAKELYPELEPVIAVLYEKMKCLVDVTDILSSRFLQKEGDLMAEMLSLKEDNARLRRLIRQRRAEAE